eukprot:TRINITY_DN2947_c0_g5_i1.p1 TRINITY_DN2947_c0_g5~~TRINITY_DN2947_c0_g5_i1.p1  ORF type:complete len:1590 (-),score=233.54 TRINITY_DN2947_c0_g5_i1:233-5002(-)
MKSRSASDVTAFSTPPADPQSFSELTSFFPSAFANSSNMKGTTRESWSSRPTPRNRNSPPWDLRCTDSARDERRARIWAICSDLQDAIGFQKDSVANQAQHLDALWESFCSRHDDPEVALADLCDQLLRSQRMWWTKVWQPLTSDREEYSPASCLRDVAIFLLLWGELGNLRYCPELICYLCAAARAYCAHVMVDSVDTIEAADDGAYLRDIVKPIFEVVLDETFEFANGKLQFKYGSAPAPAGACNYDDWNELFWDVDRLRSSILLRSEDRGTKELHRSSANPGGACGARMVWPLLANVDWAKSLKGKKTHYEMHSFLPLFVGWYRIFLMHSFVIGAAFLWYTDQLWHGRLFGSFGLIAPFWMTFHIAGFQFLTPAISWRSRCIDLTCLVLFYWSPIATFFLLTLNEERFWICHYVTSSAVAILACLARPENPHRETIHPSVLRDKLIGMSAFAICTAVLKIFADFHVMEVCVEAVRKISEDNMKDHVLNPTLTVLMERAVIFVPVGLCFLASYPLFMAVTLSVVGGARGVISFGGIRLFFYRNGFRFRELPKRMLAKLLRSSEEPTRTSEEPTSSDSFSQTWSWWMRMPEHDVSSFVNIWDVMVQELRGRDMLSNEEASEMYCKSVRAVREGNLPNILLPSDSLIWGKQGLPRGKEAKRRVKAFGRSLSVNSTATCKVSAVPSLSVLIPHYSETIRYKRSDLFSSAGSTELMRFLVKYFNDEFVNFAERIVTEVADFGEPCKWNRRRYKSTLPILKRPGEFTFQEQALLRWASVRMQTLWRTVEGVNDAYTMALRALLDHEEPNLSEETHEEILKDKLQVVVAMQQYGKFANPSSPSYDKDAQESVEAMLKEFGPCLSIAYIEESEDEEPPEIVHIRGSDEPRCPDRAARRRRYFSCLIDSSCPLTQEGGKRKPKFKIELPGFPILGHGKSDNQNCAIIFTRGEILQMIDANQDAYFEASLFLPMALQQFVVSQREQGQRIAILGFREHIFSSVGALGRTAAESEFAFGTIVQRTMDLPLKARLHYGHPDMLDKLQMVQQGGVSKGTRGLNLSEDVFAGMDVVLRGGSTSYRENFYVGKGRDMGFLSVLSFHAKVSMGNGEQAITRQWMRLGMLLPLPRMFGIFYVHVGFYLNHCFVNWGLKAFVYAVAWFKIFADTLDPTVMFPVFPLVARCFGYFLVFFALAPTMPLLLEVYLEEGFVRMLRTLVSTVAAITPVFYVFQSKLMAFYFESTIHFGGARYIATGRGLATTRESFTKLYQTFATTHLRDAAEVALASVVGFDERFQCGGVFYFCVVVSIFSWTCAPFLFNPRQFDSLPKALQDFVEYMKWQLKTCGPEETSWTTWALGVMKSRRSASAVYIFLPPRRFLAACSSFGLVYMTGHMFGGSRSLAEEVWILMPFLSHGILCFCISFLVTTCKLRPIPHAVLAPIGLGLSAAEMCALADKRIWWGILLHKYMMGRWLMQIADGCRAHEVGGANLAFLQTACEMWNLSWRFARDLFIGLVLSVFCIVLAIIPGISTLHTVFLFRTLRPKKESYRPVSRGWMQPLVIDEPRSSGQGVDGNSVVRDFFDTFAPEVRELFSFSLQR